MKKIFPFCEITLTEGDTLTITAPELGTIEVPTILQPISSNNCTALDLGWIQTAQPCIANPEGNAKLSLYTNNQHYNTLQLAYHCSCPHEAHNRYLKWFDVKIDGRTASVDTLGTTHIADHRHVIVEAFAHLRPAVKPKPAPKPVIIDKTEEANIGRHGQFNLF